MGEIKVAYVTRQGFKSKAYVTEEPDEFGVHVGDDKYTEKAVGVKWFPEFEVWAEVML